MKRIVFLLLAVMALVLFQWHLGAQETNSYRVIVHQDNPISTLSKKEVSLYFLKKKKSWGSNRPADPVDLDGKSSIRERFSEEVHGKSISSIKNYWQRQIFSGRATPPPEIIGEQKVVEFVGARPGAIGYVSPQARLDGVKVLQVTD